MEVDIIWLFSISIVLSVFILPAAYVVIKRGKAITLGEIFAILFFLSICAIVGYTMLVAGPLD